MSPTLTSIFDAVADIGYRMGKQNREISRQFRADRPAWRVDVGRSVRAGWIDLGGRHRSRKRDLRRGGRQAMAIRLSAGPMFSIATAAGFAARVTGALERILAKIGTGIGTG